jgi:signal transduction histidine kinase/DNA-binding response OmpR family regulator/sugar lactone lactonase YvrE
MNQQKVLNMFEHYGLDEDDPHTISSNDINDIFEDQDGMVWFATFSGLNRYDPLTNKFTRFQHDPNDRETISSNEVEAIFEDSHGTYWVGTRNGLNIMDTEKGRFIRYLPDNADSGSILGFQFRVIYEDKQGELWFGGNYLERLNRNDTSFIHYLLDFSSSFVNIYDIQEDDSTNLWLASLQGGLIQLKRNTMTFRTMSMYHGLPSNYISAVEIDDNGDIWAGSNRGFSRIRYDTREVRNFDIADGLLNLDIVDRSGFKDKDGWLYFGSRDGIVYFHPDSIKDNTHVPPVHITGLNIGDERKNFDKPLYELSSIELQYNENDISFDFVALDYVNPQKNQYAYMLEGYDEDWRYAGNRRSAYYTNLSPGNYTFRVKGSNNDGYWNEEGASLVVTIHPPFWTTWWAYGIYTFIFLGGLWLIRRNELNKIKLRQDLELEHVHAESLAKLDMEKNKFFSNISHEFRTPLTLILGPLDRFIGNLTSEQQKQELNLVRRNARRLQTLINQLLSLSKLESGKMTLKARAENMVRLTKLFVDSFQSMAEDKGISLEFESEAEEIIMYLDKLKYEKVVNNLLSNAFKFTEKGGKVKVSISSLQVVDNKEIVFVKFSDTGIGIRKERLPHVFDRFYQVDEQQLKTHLGTGIGLALTKELVELHRGTISVDSELGMGTSFTISLLSGKEHLKEEEIADRKDSFGVAEATILQTDDDLLADDYLFVEDVATRQELQTFTTINNNLPILLIVEDNEDMRSYIKSYLADVYQVLEATNGNEGAEIAIEQLPDIIVSDLMMPVMDGQEMTEKLKGDERTSHIPIILLTAKASMNTKLEGLETGADDFLTKPFDAKELLIRIRNLVEQRRRLQKLLSQHIGDAAQTRIIRETAGKSMSKMDEKFLEKAKAVVDEHLSDTDFSTEKFARQMAMSRTQLHRKLKGLTNLSASDFVRDIRLNKAAELLKEGELNITQVSYEIGISSLSYFSKTFREKFGVNPSEYSS